MKAEHYQSLGTGCTMWLGLEPRRGWPRQVWWLQLKSSYWCGGCSGMGLSPMLALGTPGILPILDCLSLRFTGTRRS